MLFKGALIKEDKETKRLEQHILEQYYFKYTEKDWVWITTLPSPLKRASIKEGVTSKSSLG